MTTKGSDCWVVAIAYSFENILVSKAFSRNENQMTKRFDHLMAIINFNLIYALLITSAMLSFFDSYFQQKYSFSLIDIYCHSFSTFVSMNPNDKPFYLYLNKAHKQRPRVECKHCSQLSHYSSVSVPKFIFHIQVRTECEPQMALWEK